MGIFHPWARWFGGLALAKNSSDAVAVTLSRGVTIPSWRGSPQGPCADLAQGCGVGLENLRALGNLLEIFQNFLENSLVSPARGENLRGPPDFSENLRNFIDFL